METVLVEGNSWMWDTKCRWILACSNAPPTAKNGATQSNGVAEASSMHVVSGQESALHINRGGMIRKFILIGKKQQGKGRFHM